MLLYSVLLTFAMVFISATLKGRLWSIEGMLLAVGSRDTLPEPTALMRRADRAAKNMLENLLMFTPLVLMAHASGIESELALLGSQVFVVSRVVYFPLYLGGVPWLRTFAWTGGVVGMGMIVTELF